MLTLRYNEPVFILMLRGRVGCLRQPTLPLSIRINDQNPKSALKKWKRDEKLSSTFPVFLTSPCIFNFRIMKALFEMN